MLRGHYEKAGVFGKDNNAGKNRSSGQRRRTNMKWNDSIKEATGRMYRNWARLLKIGHCGHYSFIESPRADSTAHNTHM